MVENLNWESFREKYHLKNDKYVQDVILLQRLQSDNRYPIILYPQLLREQLSKKFMIGSIGVTMNDKNHIYLHDFLNVAKQLNLKGDDWEFLVHPYNPKDATVPSIPEIPTEKTEFYKTRNWGCLIPFIIVAFLFTLPAFFISPKDPGLGIIVAILWIPFVLLMAHKMNVGKLESKIRTRRLTQPEIKQLEQEAQEKYQKDLKAYRKLREEYENKELEFTQRLNSQAALLDKYAKLIVPTIFKRCLLNNLKIEDCLMRPQRGASEDKLFYALMKEFPSYIKMDKSLDAYSPDLVLHNGCSCPIDLEIDEPYEYKTKKEIHYIGCGDEERNNYFLSNNWFVLRFTENQIKNHFTECIDIVKALVHFIEWGDTSKLYEVERTIAQIQEPRWTKEKSRMLAIENYRDNQL